LKKKFLIIFTVLLFLGLALFFFVVPGQIDGRYNSVYSRPPYAASLRLLARHGLT
jgi:hypothetical protein